jgi:FMN reductase
MSPVPSRSLVVVSAGLSQPSSTRLLADRLSAAVDRHLHDAGIEAQAEVIELRDHAQDLTNHLLTGFPSPALRATLDGVLAADGLIAVTPIFSASYSGLFKLFFDLVERDGFAGKPVLIAATGGTARHSLAVEHAIRPLFAYLNAAVVATGVYAATEDWGHSSGDAVDDSLVERIDRAAHELAVSMAAREPIARRDDFADPVPFDLKIRSSQGRRLSPGPNRAARPSGPPGS